MIGWSRANDWSRPPARPRPIRTDDESLVIRSRLPGVGEGVAGSMMGLVDLRSVNPEDVDLSKRLSLPAILDLRRLDPAEVDADPDEVVFEGPVTTNTGPRVFGGQVFGQAVAAGGRTMPEGYELHHVTSYFLRPADGHAPIRFHVKHLRDGRAFTQRIVEAIQHGRRLFYGIASGHVPEPGYSHQVSRFEGPGPEESPTGEEWLAEWPREAAVTAIMQAELGLDLRFPVPPVRLATLRGEVTEPRQSVWMRSRDRLPDLPDGRSDPVIHAAALAYLSDLLLVSASLGPHRRTMYEDGLQFATINHALWLHAPVRVDEWVRYEQSCPWMGNGTNMGRGELFAPDGRMVGSVAQEGLVRFVQ